MVVVSAFHQQSIYPDPDPEPIPVHGKHEKQLQNICPKSDILKNTFVCFKRNSEVFVLASSFEEVQFRSIPDFFVCFFFFFRFTQFCHGTLWVLYCIMDIGHSFRYHTFLWWKCMHKSKTFILFLYTVTVICERVSVLHQLPIFLLEYVFSLAKALLVFF